MEANEVAIIIGAISALVVAISGGFFAYTFKVTSNDRKEYKAERLEASKDNAKAFTALSKALNKNTESNKRIADEAEKRNGHLATLSHEGTKQILTAITNLDKKQE